MIEAFIFDMDGVIIDSEPLHFEADMETLRHLGVEVGKEALERFVGMTNPEMWELLAQEYKIRQNVDEIIEYQMSYKINALRLLAIDPIDGIADLLEALRRHAIPVALASSSPRMFIEAVLAKFGLAGSFDAVMSGEEVPKGKPAPDVYLAAARAVGADPEKCVVLEDSRNGIAAAKAAGMRCIGFYNPNSGDQDLTRADLTVRSIRDIAVPEGLLALMK